MVHDKKGVKTFSNLMKADNDVDDDDGDWKTFPKDFEGFLPSTVDEKLMNSFHTRQHSQQNSVCIDDEGW